jgi:hypothetical protein
MVASKELRDYKAATVLDAPRWQNGGALVAIALHVVVQPTLRGRNVVQRVRRRPTWSHCHGTLNAS